MNTVRIGPLDACVVTPRVTGRNDMGSPHPPHLFVLLHGFGAPGDDLVSLADAIELPPGSAVVFPQAPLSLRQLSPLYGNARAWWMIDLEERQRADAHGVARDLSAQVPEGMAEARAQMLAFLDALPEAVAMPRHRLVLGGFSQGAMLSLDVALHDSARPIAGLVQLSGTLLAERVWSPLMPARKGLRVFQSHGTEDALLPFAAAERLRGLLVGAGLDVTFESFVGPHTIPPRTITRLNAWLAGETD